jgi:hypothetical protein
MGFDCGFDIFPRLEATAANSQTYKYFLDKIILTYDEADDEEGRRADGKVLEMPNGDNPESVYIQFMVGECPQMPSNPDRCDYFLRFSSQVSGRLTTPALPYIQAVHKIAQKHFGGRVHFWHENNETEDERQWGYYTWDQVHDAKKELRELETKQKVEPAESLLGGATTDEMT